MSNKDNKTTDILTGKMKFWVDKHLAVKSFTYSITAGKKYKP